MVDLSKTIIGGGGGSMEMDLGPGLSLGDMGDNADVNVGGLLSEAELYQASRMERVVRPNVAQVWFSQVPTFIPPPPIVPSAHARWGKAGDMRLMLDRESAPYLSSSGGNSGQKQKKTKRDKKPGTYQFQEISRQTSQQTVTSDDGKCSVTFERIDEVTFKGPQEVHFVFKFDN